MVNCTKQSLSTSCGDFQLTATNSGHLCLDLLPLKTGLCAVKRNEAEITRAASISLAQKPCQKLFVAEGNDVSTADILKIHRHLGHASSSVLWRVFSRAGKAFPKNRLNPR